ncbi:MAG: hypothetical protein JRM73_02610 [Nitrososphaerota archaeon]|nr:hypothetical protein [Nitrososphaerota archaeon]
MDRSVFGYVLGMAVVGVAVLVLAASILLVIPLFFYASFPLGTFGLIIAALGLRDGDHPRGQGRLHEFSGGIGLRAHQKQNRRQDA